MREASKAKKMSMHLLIALGAFLIPQLASAYTVFTDSPTYAPIATVLFTVTGGHTQINLYYEQGTTPIAYTTATVPPPTAQNLSSFGWSSGSFSGSVDGLYQIVVVDTTACGSLSYSACLSANPGAASAETEFEISSGPGPTPAGSTSTPDQYQQNLFLGIILFILGAFFWIYILTKATV